MVVKDNKKKSDRKPNHIEEYFADKGMGNTTVNELFNSADEDIDVKTDISEGEIRLINTMFQNDNYLEDNGIDRVFENYLTKHMRLKISKDRESRKEFVDVNRKADEPSRDASNALKRIVGIN